MPGNSDQERLRILKQEIEKQKKIAAERKKAIERRGDWRGWPGRPGRGGRGSRG